MHVGAQECNKAGGQDAQKAPEGNFWPDARFKVPTTLSGCGCFLCIAHIIRVRPPLHSVAAPCLVTVGGFRLGLSSGCVIVLGDLATEGPPGLSLEWG